MGDRAPRHRGASRDPARLGGLKVAPGLEAVEPVDVERLRGALLEKAAIYERTAHELGADALAATYRQMVRDVRQELDDLGPGAGASPAGALSIPGDRPHHHDRTGDLMRVDLPDGQWAELLDVADLRAGDMKAMRRDRPVFTDRMSTGHLDQARDVLLIRVITAWSLDLPIPKELPGTPEEAGALDRVTIPAYNALVDALDPYFSLINGTEAEPPAADSSADPEATA